LFFPANTKLFSMSEENPVISDPKPLIEITADASQNRPLVPGPSPGIAPEETITDKTIANAENGQKAKGENDDEDYSKYKKGDKIENFVILDIFFVEKNYIIFSSDDAPQGIRYYYNGDDLGRNLKKIQTPLSKLVASLDIVGEKSKYQYNIASVYAICFNGDTDGAQGLINLIFEQSTLNVKTRTMGKINYLGFCLGITLIGLIASVIAQYWLDTHYSAALYYFKIAVLGSVGGFISIAIKVSRSDINFDKSYQLQIFSAISREFIGIFSALAIYLFIKSGLVIGMLTASNNVYVFYAFAVLAGFSESFVPDFFGVIEKKTITGQTQQKDNDSPSK
jgi:hypothetical protein